MHIPENYLSPATCAVMGAAMVPVWVYSVRKVKKEVSREKMPLIGVSAAFSFLAMMFNVPLPGGTTGHAVGGTLIALLLGPEAACLAVSIALAIQAVLFGDGGILSFGANCFNMAFVLPFLGYAVFRLINGKEEKHPLLSAGAGAYCGINAAAFMAAIEFGIQPLLYKDAAGQALYCPYPLSVSIPAMMAGHLTVFGLVEVLFTVALYAYVRKTSKEFTAKQEINAKPLYALMLALIALVPLGLLAEGTAWGEWGAEDIMETTGLGYVPSGLENGWSLSTIFPDYSMAGLPDIAAYILSAVIGAALCVIIFRLASGMKKEKTDYSRA